MAQRVSVEEQLLDEGRNLERPKNNRSLRRPPPSSAYATDTDGGLLWLGGRLIRPMGALLAEMHQHGRPQLGRVGEPCFE